MKLEGPLESDPLPKCPSCKSPTRNTRLWAERKPREQTARVYVECLDCGHKWQICGVRLKRDPKTRCGRPPIAGRRRCRMHGGAAKRGAAHHKHKGCGYSQDLPDRLADRYEAAIRDPELLSCRAEVALLHARVVELVKRLHTGESGSLWRRLRQVFDSLQEAMRSKDTEKVGEMLTEMGKIVKQGAKDERVWAQLIGTIDAKTRLSDREVNRLRVTQQIITAEQAMTLVAALAAAVRRAVPDDTALQAKIGANMQQVLECRGSDAFLPEGPPAVIDAKPAATKDAT